MDALIPEAEADPQGWLADIEARAHVEQTIAGDGAMVWRIWGEGEAEGEDKGKPLVLLHGGHGAWSHWCRNIDPLVAAGFRVIVADLPGLGDSWDPGPPYTADAIGAIVHYGLCQLVGAAPVHLVGFSFGAVIGGVVAEKLGDQLASFNMVGAAGFGPRARRPEGMVRILPDMSAAERQAAAANNMGWLMLAKPENVGALAVHIQLVNSDRARTISRPISMTERLLDALPAIAAPVNAVWGSFDRAAGGLVAERVDMLRDIHPDARVDLLEGIGHWAQFEAADRYNAVLLEGLAAASD